MHRKVHLRLKLKVHLRQQLSCTEDADGGTRFRAQECTRRFNKKLNLRGHSMLHLSTPEISL